MSALTTLQTYIYQLRRLLAASQFDGESFLVTRPAGYLARVADDGLDVRDFERLVEAGRAAMDAANLERAAALMREALALWRGPALVDIPRGTLLQAHATLLEERRVGALEQRIDADLQLGDAQELVGELRTLVAAHPLREGFHAQLMTALARSGRRFEALVVYQQLRRTLIDELGLEPSRPVQELQQAILNADQSLDGAPRPRAVVPALHREESPAQLPPDIGDFVGRRNSLRRLEELGGGDGGAVRLVVVTGQPGIGKTVLAVRTAHRLKSRFPDGQLWAELGGGTVDPGEVLAGFLRALGVPDQAVPIGLDERSRLFRTLTARRAVLVGLDDAGSSAQVQPLLPASPRGMVIVTSVRPLRALAGALVVKPDVLLEEDAIELLAAIIGRARVGREPEAARAVVRLCDRLPLAVRTAGARIAGRPQLSLTAFAARLGDDRLRLRELRTPDLDVRAAFALAANSLSEEDQRAFGLLSQFRRRPFATADAARSLKMDAAQAEAVLSRLVETHLLDLVAFDSGGEAHYRYRDLVWLFAQEFAPRMSGPVAREA